MTMMVAKIATNPSNGINPRRKIASGYVNNPIPSLKSCAIKRRKERKFTIGVRKLAVKSAKEVALRNNHLENTILY